MNRKGQALVEFIIIMPVMIFILLAIIDFGTYNYNKNRLEGILNNVNSMYSKNEAIDEIKHYINKNDKTLQIEINDGGKYSIIVLTKKYNFITPGLEKILNNEIRVERTIYNE